MIRALSSSSRVMSPWLAPVLSQVIISRRCFGGTAVIAASITARRSAVVSDPAPPLPSIPASASVVLSQ